MLPVESSRLLKAESIRGLGSKIAFNYDDLQKRCETYLDSVRLQARQMLADARAEAEAIKAKALADGKARGEQEGLNVGQQELDRRINVLAEKKSAEQLKTALPALKEAAAALTTERDRWLTHWQSSAIRLSVAIAEKILHRELARKPEIGTDIVTDALRLAAGSPQIRLRLHPDDIELFGKQCEEIIGKLAPGGSAALVPDVQLARGGCLIETQHGIIDAQLETQLARIASELSEL